MEPNLAAFRRRIGELAPPSKGGSLVFRIFQQIAISLPAATRIDDTERNRVAITKRLANGFGIGIHICGLKGGGEPLGIARSKTHGQVCIERLARLSVLATGERTCEPVLDTQFIEYISEDADKRAV